MNNPLVSVIIVVKNGERFIQTALESVLSQTYSPLEILVIDGNSTDGTREIVRKFDQVRIIDQTGVGIGNAYNTGISAACGEFIAFLSSDDYWTPDKITRQILALQKDPLAMIAVCLVEFFLNDPQFIPPGFRFELLEMPRAAYIMETLCAQHSAFKVVGPFNEEMRTSEDVDWFARAADLQVRSIIEPHVLLHKRIHDKNIHLESKANNSDLLRAVKNSIKRKQELLKHENR